MVTIEDIHQKCKAAWKAAGKKGTAEIITGQGKTKIALDLASEFPQDARILFLAEASQREIDLAKEIQKWNYTGAPIEFMCYQSAYKLEGQNYDFVIADRILSA
jgi:hypothetical protein